jgi:predicted nucleotidyltransferase
MFKELNIMRPFFDRPEKDFAVREFAKETGITPATASRQLKEMKEAGLLSYRKERILDLYKANFDSASYRDLKAYYNIRKIRESGLLEALDGFYLKPAVLLFGSAAFGMDTSTSDFDIVVISENTKAFPETAKFEKKLGREIQLFVVKDIRALKNDHLVNSALNGIVLQGEIKWI